MADTKKEPTFFQQLDAVKYQIHANANQTRRPVNLWEQMGEAYPGSPAPDLKKEGADPAKKSLPATALTALTASRGVGNEPLFKSYGTEPAVDIKPLDREALAISTAARPTPLLKGKARHYENRIFHTDDIGRDEYHKERYENGTDSAKRPDDCPDCFGSGIGVRTYADRATKCPGCGGTGIDPNFNIDDTGPGKRL